MGNEVKDLSVIGQSRFFISQTLLATGAKAVAAPTRERHRAAVFMMTGYDKVIEDCV